MSLSSLVNAIKDAKGGGTSTDKTPYGAFYTVNFTNWYKSFPYAFKAIIDGQHRLFYLPINPQNLTITTHYATNVIATLYSTVEEHSEQRYFDIVIQGTTGFAPKYVNEPNVLEGGTNPDASSLLNKTVGFVNPSGTAATFGRQAYQSGEVLSSLAGGFFQKTLGQLDQAINRASDAAAAIQGKSKPFQAGVFMDNSGYLAFHNLYRFFLAYKKSAVEGKSKTQSSLLGANVAGPLTQSASSALNRLQDSFKSLGAGTTSAAGGGESPLTFINYKDGNQYSCSIQRFTLERSAENPMLYNYSIQLRAYNLKPLSGVSKKGLQDDALARAGLGANAPSLAARLKGGVRNAKGAINALSGAFGNLGR